MPCESGSIPTRLRARASSTGCYAASYLAFIDQNAVGKQLINADGLGWPATSSSTKTARLKRLAQVSFSSLTPQTFAGDAASSAIGLVSFCSRLALQASAPASRALSLEKTPANTQLDDNTQLRTL
jgi:hypothetical protein